MKPASLTNTPSEGRVPDVNRVRIQSRLIYWGIVILMASLLLWLGVQLARRIEWFLPYSGGTGLFMIAFGYFLEIRKARKIGNSKPNQPEHSAT